MSIICGWEEGGEGGRGKEGGGRGEGEGGRGGVPACISFVVYTYLGRVCQLRSHVYLDTLQNLVV